MWMRCQSDGLAELASFSWVRLVAQVPRDADELDAACDQSLDGFERSGIERPETRQIDPNRPCRIRARAEQVINL